MRMRLFVVFLFSTASVCCFGQNLHTGLFYKNLPILNPAFSGHQNLLNASAAMRSQWNNLENHPVISSFSANTSLWENQMGMGLVIIREDYSLLKNLTLFAQPAYKITGDDFTLSFGLNVGISNESINFNQLHLDPEALDDPLFQAGNEALKLSFGAGIAYSNQYFNIGISIPTLSRPVLSGIESINTSNERAFVLTTTATFPADYDLDVEPLVMVKYQKNARLHYDVGVNFIAYKVIGFGLFTRNLTTFGARVNAQLGKLLDAGYAFELASPASLGTDYSTHEVNLSLHLRVFRFHDH